MLVWTTLASIYLRKVKNKNIRTRCEICCFLCRFGVFIVNLTYLTLCSSVSIVNFQHVIAGWDGTIIIVFI